MVARACKLLVCLLIGSNILSRGEFWDKGINSEMKITVVQFLTSELRSMSKLFGLFQVLFVLFLFLNTQAQCFAFELKLLYYHTGKCANYEFTCDNGKCLSKRSRCRYGDNCDDDSDEQQCRKFVITVTVVQILQSPFLLADG